jgi:hypothetical protein
VAVEAVPGTPFAVATVAVAPTTSGPAIASLVCGAGSILVSLVVACFAAVGAQPGWGAVVAGAFAVLAVLAGVAAIVLGQLGRRQIRRAVAGPVSGKGSAVAGITCGVAGVALTGIGMVAAVLLQVS